MRAMVCTLSLAAVVTLPLAGCRVATEYVPRTPGRATIGVERGAVGVYKNGTFERMGAPVEAMLACAPPAVRAATRAAEYETSARFNATIAAVGWSLVWIFPPLVGLGAGMGALSERDREASFAFAVDAVNLHNDAAACGSPAPTAGGPS